MSEQMSEQKKSFKSTLNLPTTEFSIRANAAIKEPEIRARWTAEQLDEAAHRLHEGADRFVLHDGPPYANGHIHMGTALNKVLKDIVIKTKRMSGLHAPFVPGWDCHGLPIELKVLQEQEAQPGMSSEQRVAFKKQCRQFAAQWIETQREEFKNLGVLADWDNYYSTMNPEYEACIVRAFAQFVEQGYIERKGKTVPWCSSCQTVLATAEIEHRDRKDPSIYVLFPFKQLAQQQGVLHKFITAHPQLELSFLAWTTTPWTLPLNRALIVHPAAEYAVIRGHESSSAFIVGKELAARLCQEIGIECEVLATFASGELAGALAEHPFIAGQQTPILHDESVGLDQGTACVHSAPGCGPEDYVIGVKNGLEIFSPLSPDGYYTQGILPVELEGMAVKDGQGWVIKTLQANGRLLHKQSITHAYPHCWRCKNGLMFRATDQWFCTLEKNNLVPKTLDALKTLQFIPDWGINRLSSSIAHRTEWCISRQRQWGTPIIAFFCTPCGQSLLDAAIIRRVADGIAQHGIEYWDRVDSAEFDGALRCKNCGNTDAMTFEKERDILDVWFDSGVSHYAVLKQSASLSLPADLYLEGSDQHRGWFQSSTLTSMVLQGRPCTQAFMTHGYVVDGKGHKMSKSVGNVIAPHEVVSQFSTDILRLWVASTDFEKDIVISNDLLKNIAEVYRKIRNTCRFMLANLYDFDVQTDGLRYKELKALDRYALGQLTHLSRAVRSCYDDYNFTTASQLLANYCTLDLSSFYLDIIKDRLYVEQADGRDRRSAQTALYHILDTLTHLMAPILSYLAEEVSDHYQKEKDASIHLQSFVLESSDSASELAADTSAVLSAYGAGCQDIALREVKKQGVWGALLELRAAVLKALEQQREAGTSKHSLEAAVTLYLDPGNQTAAQIISFLEKLAATEDVDRFLKDWFIVSQVTRVTSPEGCDESLASWAQVSVVHAPGTKCPRCWHWDVTEHPDGLCARCAAVVALAFP